MNFLMLLRCCVVFVLLTYLSLSVADERRLLLITKPEYKPLPLNNNELRRLFLGMSVYRNGEQLKPLINKSGDLCYQVFLQSILGMSQKRYERALLSNLYRQGIDSPAIYTDKEKLITYLKNNKNTISFLFDYGDGEDEGLNVVQEIWISEMH